MKSNKHYIFLHLTLAFIFPLHMLAQSHTFSLEQCVDYALENSTTIRRVKNSIVSDSSILAQSRKAYLPNLVLSVNPTASSSNMYSHNENSDPWNSNSTINLTGSLNSNVTLYQGGKIKNTITQNMLNLQSSNADKETKEEQLAIKVLSSYINVLLAKEQVKNNKVRLQSTKKQLEYARIRNTAGVISNADYLNIKSQRASDKVDSVKAENSLRLNLIILMQTMNMPVSSNFDILEPDLKTLLSNPTEIDAEKLYNITLEHTPEVKSAAFDVEKGKTGIELAKTSKYPTVTLSTGLRGQTSYNPADKNTIKELQSNLSPSVGVTFTLPLYQRGTVNNQIVQAHIIADNYQNNLTDIKNNVRNAVEQVCLDAQAADMTYKAIQEQHQSEQESYRMAEKMFEQGLINSVDYLTSKNKLATVENDLTRAKYAIVLQKKLIDHYLGNPVML